MAVTIAPGLEQHLRATVILLIRSDDPPGRVAAGVRAAVPDISATGMILATREEVIAGEVTGSDGTRWRPTDREWADSGRLAGTGRPSHVAGPVTIPDGQLLMIDYSSTPPRLCCGGERARLPRGDHADRERPRDPRRRRRARRIRAHRDITWRGRP